MPFEFSNALNQHRLPVPHSVHIHSRYGTICAVPLCTVVKQCHAVAELKNSFKS